MSIVFSLLLMLLGAMGAQDLVMEKVPASKKFFDKVNPLSEILGFVGLLVGFIWVLRALSLLYYIGSMAFVLLTVWISAALLMALGLIFGIEPLKKVCGENPSPPFVEKLAGWRLQMLPYKRHLGLGALALGFINIV